MTAHGRGFIACTVAAAAAVQLPQAQTAAASCRAAFGQLLCGLLNVCRQQFGICGVRTDGAACLRQKRQRAAFVVQLQAEEEEQK